MPNSAALAHVEHGAYDEFDPNPVFRSAAYLQAYGDVANLGMGPRSYTTSYTAPTKGGTQHRDPMMAILVKPLSANRHEAVRSALR